MIIVAGWIRVQPGQRAAYLAGCRDATRAARSAPGCVDFHLSADPLDEARINIFEQWESASAVEMFRRSGPSDEQSEEILDAHVEQHEISNTTSLM